MVTHSTGEATHALDARVGAKEEDAAVQLQRALDGIDHDPLIEYQAASLELFSR